MTRAALYCRCSTDDQSLLHQIESCRNEIVSRGWEIAGEYLDEGVSGSTTRRPGLDALLLEARAGRVGAVVSPSLDRIGRSAIHVQQVITELQGAGIQVVLLRERLDGSTAIGMAMLGMLACVASLERELIRQRTRVALAHKRKQAGQENAAAVTDADIVRCRRENPGLSTRAIAKQLGASKSTVANVLASARHPT